MEIDIASGVLGLESVTGQFEKSLLKKSKQIVHTCASKVFVRDRIATRQLFLELFLGDLCAIEIYVAVFFLAFAFLHAGVNVVPLFVAQIFPKIPLFELDFVLCFAAQTSNFTLHQTRKN